MGRRAALVVALLAAATVFATVLAVQPREAEVPALVRSPGMSSSPSPGLPTAADRAAHRLPIIVPASVAARPALPWCGHEVVIRRPDGDVHDAAVRGCWLEALGAGDAAEFVTDSVTVEGGRIREFYRSLGGDRVEVIIDSTGDAMSGRGWTTMRCDGIDPVAGDQAGVEFVPVGCTPPEVLGAESGPWPSADDLLLLEKVAHLAQAPAGDTLAALPFAEEVALGLADELIASRSVAELADPHAWILDADAFRGRVGPFSALEQVAAWDRAAPGEVVRELQANVGPHPHCVSPTVPPPAGVADLRRVSLQPTGHASCLTWWTVDLYLTPEGTIAAITLDLYEP